MSILISKGSDTLDNSEKGGNKGSKTGFIRLKGGQSIRVAFVADRSVEQNIVFASAEYLNHRDYEKNVHSHPCLNPFGGEDCHSCDKSVPRSKRYAIALAVLDNYVNGKTVIKAGEVGLLDVSKKQYNAIKAAVKDYIEDEAIFGMAFKLAKTGEKTESSFAISPIIGKAAKEVEAMVFAAQEVALDEDFFETGLRPKTNAQLKEALKHYVNEEDSDDQDTNESDPTTNF